MNVFLAMLVYLVLAAVMAAGIVMAVNGHFWLLIVGFGCFILGLGKVCLIPH
jgi:hypothetical protein